MRWHLTRLVTQSSRALVCGQAEELSLLSGNALSWDAYSSAAQGKTAALFSLPIEGAALLAGKSSEAAAHLAKACNPLGLLFQIQDDLLDLYGVNGRDRPASDLAQSGKVTSLVVEHLRLHPQDGAWLLPVLFESREKTPQSTIQRIIKTFRDDGALEAVWVKIDSIQCTLLETLKSANEPGFTSFVRVFINDLLRPILHTRPQLSEAECG